MSRPLTGQYFPGSSLLHRLDARIKTAALLILAAAVILTDSLLGYVVAVAAAGGIILLADSRLSSVFSGIRSLFPFFIVIFLMNTLFFTAQEAFVSWWIFTPSPGGMMQGFQVVMRVALLLVFANLFLTTTPPMEITAALAGMMRPLRIIRLPVDDIAMILSVAIQFIPVLLKQATMIRQAQIARGARFESRKLREKAAAVLPLVVPVFLSAFEAADELASAMEARGYRGGGRRLKKKSRPLHLRDMAALLCSAGLCALEWML